MTTKTFETFKVQAPIQNKFHAISVATDKWKTKQAEADAKVEKCRAAFFNLADDSFGKGTYVVYEARGELAGNRLYREIQQPRSFNIGYLRSLLTEEQFKMVTTTKVDPGAFDMALKKGLIPEAASSAQEYNELKPIFKWTTTSVRSDVKLAAGECAVVGSSAVAGEE